MELIKIVFGVILMFAAGRGATPEDQTRLNGVAAEQVEAVEAVGDRAPIVGEAGVVASALVLAAIAGHESGFWSKVHDCSACFVGSTFCDKGRSVSLYQLREGSGAFGEYTRDEICSSNILATERALKLVMRNRNTHTPMGLFKGYARGGRYGAAEEMNTMYSTALQKTGIVVSYGVIELNGLKQGRMLARWLPGRKPVPMKAQDQEP
jgi:hypothetical protein